MPQDMNEIIHVIRITAASLLLLAACKSDWKNRTAEDWTWVVLGTLGLLLVLVTILVEGWPIVSLFGMLLLTIVFIDIFIEREPIYSFETKKAGKAGIVMLVLGVLSMMVVLTSSMDMEKKAYMLSPVVMIYFFYMLYIINVIHGGADVKALMALSIIFPSYPRLAAFPIYDMGSTGQMAEYIFPFAFLILFFSALATLGVPVFLLALNISRGETRFPFVLLGYRKDITNNPGFCWPMEVSEEGEIVARYRPKKGTDVEEQFQALRNAGRDVVWVTPKIPFLIPMLAGMLLAFTIGNPFLALVGGA